MIYRSAGYKPYLWNNNLVSALLLLMLPFMLFFLIAGISFSFTFIYPTTFLVLKPLIGSLKDVTGDFYTLPNQIEEKFFLSLRRIVNGDYPELSFYLSVVWISFVWFFNSWFINRLTGAKPVSRKEEFKLYNLLENLAISVGMSSPKLAIIETETINAFSAGLYRRNYTIVVTRGLINSLHKGELESVLAHELTHIRNGDTRLMMIASLLFTVPNRGSEVFNGSFLLIKYAALDKERVNPIPLFFLLFIPVEMWIRIVLSLFMFIINGVAAHFSYKRDLVADIGSAELTLNPAALAKALLKGQNASYLRNIPSNMAGIFFLPISKEKKQSTHMSEDSRIQELKDFGNHLQLGLLDSDYQLSKRDRQKLRTLAAKVKAKTKSEATNAPYLSPWDKRRSKHSKATPLSPKNLLPHIDTLVRQQNISGSVPRITRHQRHTIANDLVTVADQSNSKPPRKTFGLRQAKN